MWGWNVGVCHGLKDVNFVDIKFFEKSLKKLLTYVGW